MPFMTPLEFSESVRSVHALNPLSALYQNFLRQGRAVLDLTLSNPTQAGFDYLKEPWICRLEDSRNRFYDPDPHGLLEAREAIRGYYLQKGVMLDPRQIFLTAGTSEAYSFVFRLLAGPGDRLLAPAPSYPLLGDLAQLSRLEVDRYPVVHGQAAWRIPAPVSEISEKTKAVLWVHPNNPTGNYVHPEENQAFPFSLPRIADEVFLDFPLAENQPAGATFAGASDGLTLTLSGISKVLGLPQMKLAWIVVSGPQSKREAAIENLEILADTYLSVSTPVQRALPGWMAHLPEIQNEIRSRVRRNLKTLRSLSQGREAVRLLEGDAGWVVSLRLPASRTDEAWALELLERAGVLTHPGYLFDFREDSHLVISLLVPPKIFDEGAARLLETVAKNR